MSDELLQPEDDDQIFEPVGYDFGFSRRSFMQVLGAGILVSATVGSALAQERRGNRGGGIGGSTAPILLNSRLHIGTDGTITVLTGKVEGGQGSRAQITQAAAEELRVPVQQIRLIMADTALTPDDGMTVGSRTTPSTLPAVRKACAAARDMLAEFASRRPEGRPISYADLAKSEQSAEAMKKTLPPDVQVTPVGEWKVLGTDIPRPGRRDIVTGAQKYPSDITRPGMLYGKVLRPPSYGATLTEIDLAPAKAMDGVVVVREGNFVGVAAPNTHLAKRAIAELAKTAKWEPAPHPSSAKLFAHLREHAKGGVPENKLAEQMRTAAKTLRGSYDVAYVQHAPMEPRAAVAEWADGAVTIWTSTQAPGRVRGEVAGAFHIPQDKVRIIVPDFGGGFGGKHTGETAVEAARIAKAAAKPLALRWTRAEEFTWASFRPAAAIECAAALDADGKLAAWHFVNINSGRSSIDPPYRVGEKDIHSVETDAPLRHGSYRALASTANTFARESFMDELALAAGKDPLAFRLDHLDEPRLRAVLETAAAKFGWSAQRRASKSTAGRGIGLACGTDKGSVVAACAEVAVNQATGDIKVLRVTQAFECGKITSPENLRSQVEGAIVMGLGPALREAMVFQDGKIGNASFWKYAVPRIKDLPPLDIHLLDRPDLPSVGAGETPLIAIAPAIANAVCHAIGDRLRAMPLRLPAQA
ncbi:MAG TPA: molybdopterin cofactor-binding domain-containing protein [Tepidisphaeraceae bacterium]|nr:molybdopterin cofactor-binding domain-containing protein [Tepidisphaeraceae bacterium]